MSISVFTGKPGNGKTLTMMHFLAEDLLRTERHIVTNIPVKLDELAEYLEHEADRRKIRVPKLHRRLTVLTTTEALYFWRFRSGGYILPKWDGKTPEGKVLPEEELLIESAEYFKQIGEKPEYCLPVSYYISEAHRYYNAKRFQKISVIAELYVTHHRHLHDEVYFDTQFAKQLAVSLRELTEEWHVLRNDYNRSIGFVKMVPRIRMASYYEMPSGSADNKPFEKRSVYIRENGVAGCYSSTSALGAIERAQDVEDKKPKKGIDLRIFVGLVTLAVIALFSVLAFAPKMIFGMAFQSSGATDSNQFVALDDSSSRSVPASAGLSREAAADILQSLQSVSADLYIRSMTVFTYDGKLSVSALLSDGQRITQDSTGFEGVNIRTKEIRYKGSVLVHKSDESPLPVVTSVTSHKSKTDGVSVFSSL